MRDRRQAWPDAELHLAGGGHLGGRSMDDVLIGATERFTSR
jgi:hypothetical protein